jgi:hypothetical protein
MRKKTFSILFIGNSFSYFNSLPKLLSDFARSAGVDLLTDGVFQGGATLKILWDNELALKKLRSKKWDYVVLQERGRLGGTIKNGIVHVGRPKPFIKYASKFHAEINNERGSNAFVLPALICGNGFIR